MRTIKMTAVVLTGLMALAGCASYQLSSKAKGAIVDSISPNSATVTFCGNAYMNKKEVEKYALQRAAMEALSKGCSHFVVMKKEDNSKICTPSFGMEKNRPDGYSSMKDSKDLASSEFSEPNVTLTIQCVPKGEKIPHDAIDAEQFLGENFPGMSRKI